MLTGLDNPFHILLVVLVVLLLFGAKRLPELGRSLGTGMREFKDSVTGIDPAERAAPPADRAPAEGSQDAAEYERQS